MADLRTLPERGVGPFEPGPGRSDGTGDRRRRPHRRRRLVAWGLALAVVASGFAVAVIGSRHAGPPRRTAGTPAAGSPVGPAAPLPANGMILVRVGGGDGESFVYRVDPSTGTATPLWHDAPGAPRPGRANPPAIGQQYAWSPDGSRLAFSRYGGDGTEIFLLSPDGTTRTQLTHDGGRDAFPSWSPDGTRIAYARGDPASTRDSIAGCEYSLEMCPADIAVIGADGTGEVLLTRGPRGGTMPSWSPDGSRIAFVGLVGDAPQVFVMNADGTRVTQLTSLEGGAMEPRWSPGGSRIAFVWTRRGGPSELLVMDAGGTDARPVMSLGRDAVPGYAWSPDGTWFVVDSNRDLREGKLVLVRPDGSGVRIIGLAPSYRVGDVAWQPVPPRVPTPR